MYRSANNQQLPALGPTWLTRLVLAVSVAMITVGSIAFGAGVSGPRTGDLPEPIYWKQTRFLIPYQWSGPSQGTSAQLVRLFISKDRGQTWQPISEAKPDLRGFTYRAESDGEYWFSIRTIDYQGRSWPKGIHHPDLRVIVDTQFPKIEELGALLATDGSMEIFWKASDQQLAADGIKLEIQAAPSETWQPVVMAEAKTVVQPGIHKGTVRSQVPAGTQQVSLRGEAYDQAGNRSFRGAEISVNEAGLSSASQFPIMVTGRNNMPENVIRGGDLSLRAENSLFNAGSVTGRQYVKPFVTKPVDNVSGNRVPGGWQSSSGNAFANNPSKLPVTSQPWPADEAGAATPHRTNAQPVALPAIAKPNVEGVTSGSPFQAVSMGSQQRTDTTTSALDYAQTPYKNVERGELAPHSHASSSGVRSWLEQFGIPLPPGTSPMVISARTFDLEYSLESVNQWGVSRVELWGTRDGGKSWRNYALDDDNRSPLRVTVEGEGIYGFRIVAHSAGGLAANSPKPGDVPELWVGVDLERPQGELLSVQQGVGNLADHLVIRWRAHDVNLAAQPIDLFYSSRGGGPWSAIATGLQNTGEYSWRTERYLPSQFYIRMEVRDAAGNVATHQTPQPVILNRSQPAAKLRGVLTPSAASAASDHARR